MSNPTAPYTKITLKGTEYHLLFDFQAVADAEELTGRSLITGLHLKDFESPSIKLVQAMLYACMKHNHPTISFELAKTFVTMKTIGKIWGAVTDAWAMAMNEPDEDTASGEDAGQS
jgi:hypothetical protein